MPSFQNALYSLFPESEGAEWAPSPELLKGYDREGIDFSPFLDAGAVRENALWAELPPDWEEDILRASGLILRNASLLKVFSLVSQLLIHERTGYKGAQLKHWPDPEQDMGEDAPLFYLLVTLNCIPFVRELHRRMGIPEDITRDTCAGIGTKCLDYFFFHGKPGVVKWAVYWFKHHLDGELFRVGRLEYMIKKLQKDIRVYRNPAGKTALTMEEPGSGKAILVRPDGSCTENTLPTDSEWTSCLSGEDYVLDIHIPGGGKLDLAAVKDSMVRAVDFFDRFFPEKKTRGFECISWIFSRDLEAVFKPEANLIRFRDQVYLFPVETEKVDGYYFLFGTFSKNPDDWPEKTSLQRNLKAHILNDGSFRLSGMVYLRDDLERFGDFPYRG